MSALPRCAASQWRRRSAGVRPLCSVDDGCARKARDEARHQLRRQVDLGHQHQGLASEREGPVGRAQVDLGLAAAGDAVQQHRPRLARRHRRGDALAGLGLGRRQGRRRGGVDRRRGITPLQAPLEAAQAVGDRGVAEAAQLGRQHRQRDLAEAALVVAGGKGDQLAPGTGQRR